jgi:NAD(P)-dependent dehydrogenase (short-subunit alcohol dehydrogenase family)
VSIPRHGSGDQGERAPAGPVVAITGGSSGIGRATAIRLGREGAAVAICARRDDRLRAVAAEVEAGGGQALPIVADVTREADVQAFVARTVECFGRLDVMIANAGFGIAGPIDDVSPDRMRRMLDVNYMGTYHAAQAALRVFRQRGHGHVIVVSSVSGRRGMPYMGVYAAAKFAQVGLAESLRAELVGTRIHVTTICPASTATEFFDVMAKESGAVWPRAIGRRQPPERVADAIARVIRHPAPEVFLSTAARALVLLNALAPGMCDRIVNRFGRQALSARD